MKKLVSLVLAMLMMVVVLTGCAEKPADNTDADKPADTEMTDWEYIADKGEMTIGITLFAPMNYKDDNGELTGFETEFAKAVCEKLGVTAKFQEIDWNSKETELSSKNIDCIWNGMTITDDRIENMNISVPYMENKQVAVALTDKAASFAAEGGMDGAIVVAETGSAGEEVAQSDAFFASASYTPVDAQAKALFEVKSGTADVAVIDYVMTIGSIGEGTDYEDISVIEGASFAPEQYGIAFRKGSDTRDKVNEAIAALMADGTVDTIAAKYKLDALLVK